MIKILGILFVIIAFNYSSCKSQNQNIKLSVILDDCVLYMNFENLTKDEQWIPNYYAMADDTLHGMLVMPIKNMRINKDTLIIASYHVKHFEGRKDTLVEHDLSVSHLGEGSKINIVSNTVLLKKNNTQILRMPNDFCSYGFLYCSIYSDGELLTQSKIKSKEGLIQNKSVAR